MLTTNGVEVNWKTFNYFLNYYTSYVEQYVGTVSDWSTEYQDNYSYADFVNDGAIDSSKSFGAIAAGAKELGVEMTQEDLDEIDQAWEDVLASYDSMEDAQADMDANGIDEDVYKTISYYSALSDKCYAKLYGESGANLTDQECAEYTADDGYMMAKHILLMTTKTEEVDGTSQSVDMTDEEKAQLYSQMEGFLAQLDACAPDEVEAKFDELMNEYSEDTGLANFPDGYLFQDGEMVTEFEDAVKALDEYEYSGIVTTDYGYHIILRLPINYDVVPSAYSTYIYYGYNYTLRYLVSQNMYNSVMENWIAQADVVYTDSLNNLDLKQLYK
jgi:hypothetical protein